MLKGLSSSYIQHLTVYFKYCKEKCSLFHFFSSLLQNDVVVVIVLNIREVRVRLPCLPTYPNEEDDLFMKSLSMSEVNSYYFLLLFLLHLPRNSEIVFKS